jgi:hypothetical protein
MSDVKSQMPNNLIRAAVLWRDSVQFVVQSLKTDAEEFRRPCLIIARFVERAENHLALDLLERRAYREGYGILGTHPLTLIERIWREVMPLDLFTRTNHDRTLNHIAQFAYVPGHE